MSMYDSPGGMQDLNVPKASQACLSCRKQKRKCNKALPACALCARMNRHCDYSDVTPSPTSEDFHVLRMKLLELEGRLNATNALSNPHANFASSSAAPGLAAPESLGPSVGGYPNHQEDPWNAVQNRFPAISFLDSQSFKTGGFAIPKPSIEIPVDALELLGDGPSIQAVLTEYFATIHKWMPIVSQKRMTRNMANPLWEAGPDLALLFLCMKLIVSGPQDGVESTQNPVYASAKRFLALLEASGAVSLTVLQAALLITWFEYGQAIYPAAWMSAGWCVRYGNLLGINNDPEAIQLLGRTTTWIETEERRRAWWGVLIADRVVSVGSQGYILNPQEPQNDSELPVDDYAWDQGDIPHAAHGVNLLYPLEEPVASFPRLCQASTMLGKVLSHRYNQKAPSKTDSFTAASDLYMELSILERRILEEAGSSPDYLTLAAPLSITLSALSQLCLTYSCPPSNAEIDRAASKEAVEMQARAIDGHKAVTRSISDLVDHVHGATQSPQDLGKVSPIVMGAMYKAAANYAWMVRENGDESSQVALDAIRLCFRRLGSRWRNAAEYLRILEAQEFTYAVGSAGS